MAALLYYLFMFHFKSSIFINSIFHLSPSFNTTLPNAELLPFLPSPLSKFILPLGMYIVPPPLVH